MKNRVFILVFLGLVLSLVTGCRDELENFTSHSSLKWATADRRALEAEYILVAKQQNAGLASKKFGESVSQDQLSALEEEMDAAEAPAELRCMKPELRASIEKGGEIMCSRYRRGVCESAFDMQCIADIKKLPEIQVIKKKIDSAKSASSYQRKIDAAIREKSKSSVNFAIASYASENSITLIVNRSADAILFTESGETLDVTAAVLLKIREIASAEKLTIDEVDALVQ
jgi:hypothetical protein